MNKVILLSIFFPLTLLNLTSIMLIRADAAELRPTRELILFYDEKDIIASATKHLQGLQQAPAVATVISAEEIRNMGARDIIDVLKTVPGIGVTKGYYGKEEIEVRGIKTTNSEKVKLLIDGHSINDSYSGGPVWGFDGLSIENVKRIEIIRGPGSALYGSNAFSAIINVVTKDGKDIDGIIVSAGGGSFDTLKANIQAGTNQNDLDIALSLDYLNTDGPRLKIDKDKFGKSGHTEDFEEKMEADLKLAYKDFTFNSKYVGRRKGSYLGVAYAVNDDSKLDTFQYFGELSFKRNINENAHMLALVYTDVLEWDAFVVLSPKGIPGFSDGKIGGPGIKERGVGAEMQFDYKLNTGNIFTVGASAEKRDQFQVNYKANFDPINGAPLGSFQDVRYLGNWNQEKSRDIWAAYLQDVWNITEDVALTLGVRHDHYSDFGDTTNPRAAIVWNFLKDWDLKFLYGQAFRAPSFEELYNINNPVVLGNPGLKPEKMRTYEASVGHSYGNNTKARISYFNNIFEEKIQLMPQTTPGMFMFFNSGGARVQGLEAEIKSEVVKDAYVYANYTYQDPKDEDTGKVLPDVPNHKGNIGANIGLTRYLNVNSNIFISGERPRADGDPRDAVPSYALVDLTLIAKDFYESLEIRGSAHNLLDQKYSDPATAGTVPGDFPREGTSFMLEALYKF